MRLLRAWRQGRVAHLVPVSDSLLVRALCGAVLYNVRGSLGAEWAPDCRGCARRRPKAAPVP